MDEILFPDETDPKDEGHEVEFEHTPLNPQHGHPSGMSASKYVTITFDRFVTLVANHSFADVVEANQDEEVIISTNLLTDLANARRFSPNPKPYLMILAGLAFGIFVGYLLFQ